MAEASANYQLILEKIPDEKQPEAALFLSGCFSLPPASTRGIAASGPIALISDMAKAQAEAVLNELTTSIPPGVDLRVAPEEERSRISRLQWPRPPRIYGSALDEFITETESHEAKCPVCGTALRITQDGGEIQITAASGAEKRRSTDTGVRTLAVPDRDPLFSGVKPLAQETGKYASIRSLQAGDTGFWMDHTRSVFSPAATAESTPSAARTPTDSSHAKRSNGKSSAGLAAFMKPGSFAVVLGRTKDAPTIKIVSEIMGIPESEARDRCLNLGTCVARDISLDEAQTLLARFQNLGTRVRIVRPS